MTEQQNNIKSETQKDRNTERQKTGRQKTERQKTENRKTENRKTERQKTERQKTERGQKARIIFEKLIFSCISVHQELCGFLIIRKNCLNLLIKMTKLNEMKKIKVKNTVSNEMTNISETTYLH